MREDEEPLGGTRGEQLGQLIEEEGGEGSTAWASFNWVRPVELQTALQQQARLTELLDARNLLAPSPRGSLCWFYVLLRKALKAPIAMPATAPRFTVGCICSQL